MRYTFSNASITRHILSMTEAVAAVFATSTVAVQRRPKKGKREGDAARRDDCGAFDILK